MLREGPLALKCLWHTLRAERDSFAPGLRSGPADERRRIHLAAAEDASGGSGGCAASTPQLNVAQRRKR
jgi:hypothetical protein